MSETTKATPTTGMPLFFKSPAIIDPQRHADAGYVRSNLSYAAHTNAIPLAADEFIVAQAYYPIVFSMHGSAAALAIVGLQPEQNLFVNATGEWRPGFYIPAYVRRYPFVFIKNTEGQFVLAVDEAAESVTREGGEKFFAEGKPTQFLESALEFCSGFQHQYELSQQFIAALEVKDLLIEFSGEMKFSEEHSLKLSGFRIIDEKRFKELSAEVIEEWRQKGWLSLIYAHFFSGLRWEALRHAMLTEARAAA